MENLYQKIDVAKETIRKYKPEVIAIPDYIQNNLRYTFFDWQKDAFENFLAYEADYKENPTHLMFNLATGTGKTMLMASCLLYYYKQGYRHFIFFVNQNNIVDKTENNFIDTSHNKYLFSQKIVIDDKTVDIKKVSSFSKKPNGIEIKFTTIQKLYNDIHIEKENQVILDELLKKDVVMFADEAHHLNADTRKKQDELNLNTELKDNASLDEVEKKGWEHTVLELLLNKNGKDLVNRNVLLEFTATIPSDERVVHKYSNKIISKFGLKEFLSAGYTKEINLISSTLDKKERILHALLFNWYRHKIAIDNGISDFKPVVLFRSQTIEQSKEDFKLFLQIIKNLKSSDFDFLKRIQEKVNDGETSYEQGKSRTLDVVSYVKNNKNKYSEIVDFIQYSFSERNCIITNSKDGTKTKEKTTNQQETLLNSLEDRNNHIRAIFTVERLTEGWDVLNLYDIVRLYQGTNAGGSNTSTPEATVKEKQLIGRGVRYYPFTYNDLQRNKRKFDGDLNHPLRALEELYYHTYDEESRYISHLKNELRKDGYIEDSRIVKKFSLKKDFVKSDFYNDVKVLVNSRIDNPQRQKKTLADVKKSIKLSPYKLRNLEISEQELNLDVDEDTQRLNLKEKGLEMFNVKIKDFETHIFFKAVNIKAKSENSLLRFDNLVKELVINSLDELQKSFLADFELSIVTNGTAFSDITNQDKLEILLNFFDRLQIELLQISNPKKGTEFKSKSFKELFFEDKEKSVFKDDESNQIEQDLKFEDWYVLDSFYGTSEEKALIRFIESTIGTLKRKYKEVYILRNEEQYKIYDYEQGRGFQPDFILFLKKTTKLYYQVFIEPKGDNLLEKDAWKNDFLKEITERHGEKKLLKIENKDYALIGLPLFNESQNGDFLEGFDTIA